MNRGGTHSGDCVPFGLYGFSRPTWKGGFLGRLFTAPSFGGSALGHPGTEPNGTQGDR